MMSNANLFRRMARAEETMIREVMPKTSAADPVPPPVSAGQVHRDVRTFSLIDGKVRRVAVILPLTYSVADAAKATR